jgi:hypothetical protein
VPRPSHSEPARQSGPGLRRSARESVG